jgi:predicted transcriptional regulator
MDDDAVLDLENRRRIFRYVSRFQGAHLREIRRELGLEVGVLKYHLDYLEKSDLLSSRKGKYRKRYFTKAISPKDKELLSLLRQKPLRGILMHVLLHPNCTFKELLESFEISKSTLSFHLKKLREADLIESEIEETEGTGRRPERFKLKRESDVAGLLITYKSSFLDDAVDMFVELWSEI